MAFNIRLAGAFNGQTQSAITCDTNIANAKQFSPKLDFQLFSRPNFKADTQSSYCSHQLLHLLVTEEMPDQRKGTQRAGNWFWVLSKIYFQHQHYHIDILHIPDGLKSFFTSPTRKRQAAQLDPPPPPSPNLLTSFFRVDSKLIDLIGHPLHESLAVDLHLAGISNLALAHVDLEGRIGDVLTIPEHID